MTESRRYPTDTTLSFKASFMDGSRGNYWSGLPRDLFEFLEKIEGTMSGIVDRMEPGEYIVTVSIKSPSPHE